MLLLKLKFQKLNQMKKKEFKIVCRVKGDVTIDNLPSIYIFTYIGKDFKIQNQVGDFIGSFKLYSPPQGKTINILLMGLAGACKSSFINTVLTMLNNANAKIVAQAPAGGSTSHVTKALGRYDLKKEGMGDVNFIDTWGLTQESYTKEIMGYILDGMLADGFSMHLKLEDFIGRIKTVTAEKKKLRKIHCALIFAPQGVFEKAAARQLQLLKSMWPEFTDRGMNPLLLITKVDEINAEVRKNPVGKYPDIEQRCDAAAREFNIINRNVLCNVNYVKEDKKVFEIDKMTYKIVERVLDNAYQNLKHMSSLEDDNVHPDDLDFEQFILLFYKF